MLKVNLHECSYPIARLICGMALQDFARVLENSFTKQEELLLIPGLSSHSRSKNKEGMQALIDAQLKSNATFESWQVKYEMTKEGRINEGALQISHPDKPTSNPSSSRK